ncbi:MAG TPA: aldose epimerase family protein [Daejeonella sp.]|nr:aldose epimerase family protein [Daejeonella sp.]
MKATQSDVLFLHQNQEVYGITLENDKGMRVCLSNYGGLIQSLIVPDRECKGIDVVLGFDDLQSYLSEDYLANYPYFGAIIGRYANRIANARFPLDGHMVQVSANTPPHQLHGGFSGFDKKVWNMVSVENKPLPKAVFSYLSVDGEEGFPGNLNVEISFEINTCNELILEIKAHTDKPTAINMTHHTYFNLNGDGSFIGGHVVEIPASKYLAQDKDYVATGKLLDVHGTAHDFTQPKTIQHDWKPEEGYDQGFVLDKPAGVWGKAASVYSPQTGIQLEIFTDQPGVQFYTGKYLNVSGGKSGKHYKPFTSFCLETQQHTNAVNIPSFPNTILRPGEEYRHKTSYRFSTL